MKTGGSETVVELNIEHYSYKIKVLANQSSVREIRMLKKVFGFVTLSKDNALESKIQNSCIYLKLS